MISKLSMMTSFNKESFQWTMHLKQGLYNTKYLKQRKLIKYFHIFRMMAGSDLLMAAQYGVLLSLINININ